MGEFFDDEATIKLLGTPRVPFRTLIVKDADVVEQKNGYNIPICLKTYVVIPFLVCVRTVIFS